ncbi:hypothetical protein A3C98_02005 [Candidatus Roizmanbacteria bacterium RIFCSPHIGHO2_02_FULL_37_15]|uniref:Thymidine kinase n=1 Tax=Candidatus Roizmanbacteria bacterium RIFCSPLOWO2_01_FULL_37_16 TaxID=1802058 RepID=A0A1F7IMR9_9BACT|nr:MAG: hypothetical protein A2859_02470 [Candidatus Roizmanbacteria bacterium RIFCSPHIGHO2_01_FULL_37_16b]OGK20516.1 MAG: hypothetical protein A3C98_02005 [Candidatus Roizmanbacteria bacterium RIFCSPHIGHO2_02_FULL_37_15]OGK32210.1 MAG: hypothetical protein A3F57_01465 [Candidatus Roizmanbacteria bacterium RIFCSPHIGHO2_12_FULL_36_11]OGK44669.1 MAG: hypothetical protein A3B40_02525 [Candidatus Roizmanbacteria bacterium RIFCSPLOWO2_01_FULL_37_16]
MAKKGHLTVIAGPMFAGKTTKLITLYRVFKKLGYKVLCFKAEGAVVENRNGKTDSHDLRSLQVTFIENKKPQTILKFIKKEKPDKVLIDSTQFFPDAPTKRVVFKLLNQGIDVVVNGLLYDYKRKYFRLMHELFDLADERMELFAICERCGARAKNTERIAGSTKRLEATSKAKYIASCSRCHRIYKG